MDSAARGLIIVGGLLVAGLAVGVWITLLGIRVYDQRHFLGIKQAAEFVTGRPPAPNDFSRS